MSHIKKTSLFIISGPSGVGQDSVIEGLGKIMPIERVVTTSTRPKRAGESNGHPYYFIDKEEFLRQIKENNFFEYADEYNHNLYGVTREEIARARKSDKVVIWKMEYKGVITAKKLIPDVIAILITAPLAVVEKRLRARDKGASEEYMRERMEYSREWMKHKNIYDYEVDNRDGQLEAAIKKVVNIIKVHKKFQLK